jgi:hypothetical protein
MFRQAFATVASATVASATLAFALGSGDAAAAEPGADDLAQIRAQIKAMKDEYEARIRALETRLQHAEAKAERAAAQSTAAGGTTAAASAGVPATGAVTTGPALPSASGSAVAAAAPAPTSGGTPGAAGASTNTFNPAISINLGGTYARLSQDPARYRIQGFVPSGDEVGPGNRSFNLGESELTFSANVDTRFSGRLTFSMSQDNEVAVEEAFVRANALAHGTNLTAGRFLSSVGYLNSQHAHAWDFVDAPLAYQAFFGGQYKNDGVQLKWLAPLDQFLELGIETGRGATFPGTDRNKNGANSFAAFAHLGDDLGDSGSWRVGVSYLKTSAADRAFDDVDHLGAGVVNAFSGNSRTWIADAIYKWAPGGNATQTNFKLQGEYFRRTERGTLTYDTQGASLGTLPGDYRSVQSGWYVQGVYQFVPMWRVGARYDRLDSGTPRLSTIDSGELDPADFARLLSYNPSRSTLMVDYSPSEFSRFRVQLAQDKARPGATDRQIFLQYIMSLGVHGAHTF